MNLCYIPSEMISTHKLVAMAPVAGMLALAVPLAVAQSNQETSPGTERESDSQFEGDAVDDALGS